RRAGRHRRSLDAGADESAQLAPGAAARRLAGRLRRRRRALRRAGSGARPPRHLPVAGARRAAPRPRRPAREVRGLTVPLLIEESIRIGAPPETIWKFLSEPQSWRFWWPNCRLAETADRRPLRDGSQLELVL